MMCVSECGDSNIYIHKCILYSKCDVVSEVVVLVECVNLIASLPTYLPSSTVVSNNTIHGKYMYNTM